MENHPNRDSPYVLTHENCTYFQLVEQSGNNAIVAPAQQIQRNYRVRRKIGNRTSGTITVQPIQHSDNFHFIERRIRECLNILAGRIMPWQLRNGINFEFTSNFTANFYIACFVDGRRSCRDLSPLRDTSWPVNFSSKFEGIVRGVVERKASKRNKKKERESEKGYFERGKVKEKAKKKKGKNNDNKGGWKQARSRVFTRM